MKGLVSLVRYVFYQEVAEKAKENWKVTHREDIRKYACREANYTYPTIYLTFLKLLAL